MKQQQDDKGPEELLRAKRRLYYLLLCKDEADVTDAEAKIGFELASDPDIQKIISRTFKDQQ